MAVWKAAADRNFKRHFAPPPRQHPPAARGALGKVPSSVTWQRPGAPRVLTWKRPWAWPLLPTAAQAKIVSGNARLWGKRRRVGTRAKGLCISYPHAITASGEVGFSNSEHSYSGQYGWPTQHSRKASLRFPLFCFSHFFQERPDDTFLIHPVPNGKSAATSGRV